MLESDITKLKLLNKSMNDNMKIIKFLEEYGLLKKALKMIQNEAKRQKRGCL